MLKQEKRKDFEFLKGIGIFLVVLGHTFFPFRSFIYLFHIPIFFFINGFFYKIEPNFKDFLIKKIKSLYLPFFVYAVIFLLLHNFFYFLGFVDSLYDKSDFIKSFTYIVMFRNKEELLGAIWFIPLLFIVNLVYDILSRLLKSKILFSIVIVVLYLISFIFSSYHGYIFKIMSITGVSIFTFFTGQLYKKYELTIERYKFLSIIGIIICFSLSFEFKIDLASKEFTNPFIYFISSSFGIWFFINVSKVLVNYKWCFFMNLLGENSFHIMALHFLSFKFVSFFISNWIIKENLMLVFPTINYGNYWVLYAIIGINFPVLLILLVKKIKSFQYVFCKS